MADEVAVIFDVEEWKKFFAAVNYELLKNSFNLLKTNIKIFGYKDIIDHFQNEEEPEGAWKDWSPKYEESRMGRVSKKKKAAGLTPKKLQLSGDLRKSVTLAKDNIRKQDNYTAVLFSNKVYSAVHQYGYKYIPKREYLWLSDLALEQIGASIISFLVK